MATIHIPDRLYTLISIKSPSETVARYVNRTILHDIERRGWIKEDVK